MERWEREELRTGNRGLVDQVRELMDEFEQQRDRLAEVVRRLDDVRVQVSSPDRAVTATVDADGQLTEMTLSPEAMRGSREKLAKTIVDTVRSAAEQARERGADLAATAAGELDELGLSRRRDATR